jgi:hypothetical protein
MSKIEKNFVCETRDEKKGGEIFRVVEFPLDEEKGRKNWEN